ncbi:MAG: DUF1667 domain-containing protein [Clostridia bacterium]|nr:DUF1667 domain-containing protein [Clostridia bacterium]
MKQIICIGCPKGCHVQIDETTYECVGNACPRGAEYAKNELTDPRRTLTSTVVIEGAAIRRCPVKSDRPLPKAMVQDAAKALDEVRIEAPVNVGDVIVENILGTGCNIICARNIAKA